MLVIMYSQRPVLIKVLAGNAGYMSTDSVGSSTESSRSRSLNQDSKCAAPCTCLPNHYNIMRGNDDGGGGGGGGYDVTRCKPRTSRPLSLPPLLSSSPLTSQEPRKALNSWQSVTKDLDCQSLSTLSQGSELDNTRVQALTQHPPLRNNSLVLERLAERKDDQKIFLPDGGRLMGCMYGLLVSLVVTAITLREALTNTWLSSYVHAVILVYVYGAAFIFLAGLEIHLVRISHQKNEDDNQTNARRQSNNSNGRGRGVDNGAFEPGTDVDAKTSVPSTPGRGPHMWYKRHLSFSDLRQMSVVSERSDAYIVEPDGHWDSPLPHHTGLYLRVGVILFGLATMVYEALLIRQLHEGSTPAACLSQRSLIVWPSYVYLALLLVQTFFLFKHPQINISTKKPLIRFGFMHVLAANWCLWLRTIVKETLDGYNHGDKSSTQLNNSTYTSTSAISPSDDCGYDQDILHKATPYLFPCVVAYCLLAAATVYNMYTDLNVHHIPDNLQDILQSEEETRLRTGQSSGMQLPSKRKRNHMTEISFHRTHRGLFVGILVIAATVVSTILFFSYLSQEQKDNGEQERDIPLLIYNITDVTLSFLVLLVCVLCWFMLRRLTYLRGLRGVVLDEALLMVTTCGLLLFNLLRVMSLVDAIIDHRLSVDKHSILALCQCILAMLMAISQTLFIIDVLCRCITTQSLWEAKPGRGSLTFLLCANVAMWLIHSYQLKQLMLYNDELQEDYGVLGWTLVKHICVPLIVFYHYHCSACLAHVWRCAYTKDLVVEAAEEVPGVPPSRRSLQIPHEHGQVVKRLSTVSASCDDVTPYTGTAEREYVLDSDWTQSVISGSDHGNVDGGSVDRSSNIDVMYHEGPDTRRRVLDRSAIDAAKVRSPISEV